MNLVYLIGFAIIKRRGLVVLGFLPYNYILYVQLKPINDIKSFICLPDFMAYFEILSSLKIIIVIKNYVMDVW